jgi:threonine synthase
MTDLRRSLKCSSCGIESSVYVSGGLELREVLIAGKCPSCGTAMQVNYSVIEKEAAPEQPPAEQSSETTPNLVDSLFSSEVPSDTLKDIMED